MITPEDELRDLREALRTWFRAETYRQSCECWSHVMELMRKGHYGQPPNYKPPEIDQSRHHNDRTQAA